VLRGGNVILGGAELEVEEDDVRIEGWRG